MILTVIMLQGNKLKRVKTQQELNNEIVSVKPVLVEENNIVPQNIAVVVLSEEHQISKSDYVFYECVSENIAYKGARFATFYSGKESYVIKIKKGYIVVCDKSVKEYVNYKGERYYASITHPCIVAKILDGN